MKKILIYILIGLFINCSGKKNNVSNSNCIIKSHSINGNELYILTDFEPKLIEKTDFNKYFLEKIVLKDSYLKYDYQLRFIFEFIIEKNGKVSSVNFINKKSNELNEIEKDAIEIIKNTNWEPAKCNGREVAFLKKVNIFINLE